METSAILIISQSIDRGKTAIQTFSELKQAGYNIAWPAVLKEYINQLKEKRENE